MLRWVPLLLLATIAPLLSQQPPPPPKSDKPPGELQRQRNKAPATSGKEEVPPEEDKNMAPEAYAFNPLQAQKEVDTGNFYFKKGSYRAAAGRFREATKWNDANAEAWLRLGDAEEKLKDPKAAREAYDKYLEVAPDAKNSPEIRKKLTKLQK